MSRVPARKATPATPAKRKPKPRVKMKTVTVTFQLPEKEVENVVAVSLLEAAERRYPPVKMSYEVS